jgi:hypothetical protein
VIAEKSANAESYEHLWSLSAKYPKRKKSLEAMSGEYVGCGIWFIPNLLIVAIVTFAVGLAALFQW